MKKIRLGFLILFAALIPGLASAESRVREILILHHSHLDVGFTHSQPMLWELQKDYIGQALGMLDREPPTPLATPCWTCEATVPVMRWLETASPRDVKRFSDYVQKGQIGISAMAFNTTPLCSAEGLARQLYNVRTLRDRFADPIKVAHTHDVTGLPWAIVDELLDSGVELLVMGINLHLGGTPQPRPGLYRWKGPSGREILVLNGEHYSMFDQWGNTAKNDVGVLREGVDKYLKHLEEINYKHQIVYLTATCAPYAYDNSPPNPDLPGLIRRWNEDNFPKIRFVTPQSLLDSVQGGMTPDTTVSGDWTDYWNFGAGSSAAETALTRRAAADLAAVDLLQAFAPADARLAGVTRRAWEGLTLYNEHTWGAASSLDPDNPNTVAQWYSKAAPAYESSSLAEYALVRKLQRLAGNPPSMKKQEGVLVVNPAAAPARVAVPVPPLWRVPGKRIEGNFLRGWESHRFPDRAVECAPVELPALGWRIIPLAELKPAAPSAAIKSGKDFIESPFHRLAFDPATGRVTGLLDKKIGRQVLDAKSPWGFFQLVHEKPDPAVEPSRKAFHVRDAVAERVGKTGWKPDWKAVRTGPGKLACKIEKNALAVTLVLSGEAEGVRGLEQRITLRADSPLIGLEARFVKLDVRDPEAIYFAFPLALAEGWRSHFDTAGVPTELDAEQIPGTCRDWVTVDTFVSVDSGGLEAALYCPDAPLVQVGGFNFARKQASIPRQANPILLAWALNNYWETNFRASQPGPISLRYAFATHETYDPARALAEGGLAANPPLVHPVEACLAAKEGKFLELRGEGVRVVYVKEAEAEGGVIARLMNVGAKTVKAEISLPGRTIGWASRCGLLENPGSELELRDGAALCELEPRRLTTVKLELKK